MDTGVYGYMAVHGIVGGRIDTVDACRHKWTYGYRAMDIGLYMDVWI